MNEKFLNKYRIPSARAQWWNYSQLGAYFITICTKDRLHHFGEVLNGEMFYSQVGKIAHDLWIEIPNHFPNAQIEVFQVMPNHFHGIILIVQTMHASSQNQNSNHFNDLNSQLPIDNISTDKTIGTKNVNTENETMQSTNNETMRASSLLHQQISPPSGSIARIIGSYKSAVSKLAHSINPAFQWQPRFHDRIIRNNAEFDRIENYIVNNPKSWREDCYW